MFNIDLLICQYLKEFQQQKLFVMDSFLDVLIHSEVINLFYCVHGLSINQNLTAAFRVIWRWTGKFLFSMNISGVKEHNSEIFRIISKIYEGAFCENSQWLNRLFFVTNKIAIVDV